MFHFSFQKQKDGENTLIVYADQGWWNYAAEITFNNVLFSNCPARLNFNIVCRLATEEEESHLRSLHDCPSSYQVYCFEDTSKYYTNGPVPWDASLMQQKKSFVIAQSVNVVAYFSDRSFDDRFNLWQKCDISDLSEGFQNILLRAIESDISFAKRVEEKKRVNDPHPDSNEQI